MEEWLTAGQDLPGTPSGFFKAKPIFDIIDSFALQNSENSARSVDEERNQEGKLQLLYELVGQTSRDWSTESEATPLTLLGGSCISLVVPM